MVFFVVVWLSFGGFGAWIASVKNRPTHEGMLVGVFFGPLGCLIEALLPDGQPTLVGSPPSDDGSDSVLEKEREAEAEARIRMRAIRREEWRREWEAERRENEQRRREAVARLRAFGKRRLAEVRWAFRFFLGFGWYRSLPEVAQPIVLGLAISLPIVLAIVLMMRGTP